MRTIADWNRIKAEYIAGGISQRKLAEKHGVPEGTLIARANAEHWRDARDRAYNKAITRIEQKTVDSAAETAIKLREAQQIAVEKVLEMISEAKGTGNNMLCLVTCLEKLQKMSAPEDTNALKAAKELLEGIESVID